MVNWMLGKSLGRKGRQRAPHPLRVLSGTLTAVRQNTGKGIPLPGLPDINAKFTGLDSFPQRNMCFCGKTTQKSQDLPVVSRIWPVLASQPELH